MLIKATERFARIRLMTIPGDLPKEKYRQLQAGADVEVTGEALDCLLKGKCVVEVPQAKTPRGKTTISAMDLEADNE